MQFHCKVTLNSAAVYWFISKNAWCHFQTCPSTWSWHLPKNRVSEAEFWTENCLLNTDIIHFNSCDHDPELISLHKFKSSCHTKLSTYGFRVKEPAERLRDGWWCWRQKSYGCLLVILHLSTHCLWLANQLIILAIGKVVIVFLYYGNQATKIWKRWRTLVVKTQLNAAFLFVTALARITFVLLSKKTMTHIPEFKQYLVNIHLI